ncbi:MAG: phosphopantothenoylcysteine decarboxylase [Candidatus Brocadiia bacterium]
MSPSLDEKRILITSGPTRADIDAVRYISNRSSGKLGSRIAIEAVALGAHVTMLAGPDSIVPEPEDVSSEEWNRLRIERIETVFDLLQTLENELSKKQRYVAVIHAMAVLDYVPEADHTRKIASGKDRLTLQLSRTPKVIRQIKDWSPRTLLVGFKLEIDESRDRLREIATSLIRNSRADLAVGNNLSEIRDEKHPAIIVNRQGSILAEPGTKSEIAIELCSIISRSLA